MSQEKKKQPKSYIESALYSIVQKSLKQAINASLAEIFKDFKA